MGQRTRTQNRPWRRRPVGHEAGTLLAFGANMVALRPSRFFPLGLLLACLGACGHRTTVIAPQRSPRLVELEVEVYDPATNFVWEGVSVRVVEGFHEWSGCVCTNPDPSRWFETDETGRVLFDSVGLAEEDIGFRLDDLDRAIIEGDRDSDEAFILIELDAVGFDAVQFDVPITWRLPAVLVSLPFSPRGEGPLQEVFDRGRQQLAAQGIAAEADHPASVDQDRGGEGFDAEAGGERPAQRIPVEHVFPRQPQVGSGRSHQR